MAKKPHTDSADIDIPDLGAPIEISPAKRKKTARRGPDVPLSPPQIEITSAIAGGSNGPSITHEIIRLLKHSIIGVFLLAALTIIAMTLQPASASAIENFLRSYFETAAKFLAQVFGPLLALIAGYRFGRAR